MNDNNEALPDGRTAEECQTRVAQATEAAIRTASKAAELGSDDAETSLALIRAAGRYAEGVRTAQARLRKLDR
jgi:hypothetical protein